MKRNYVMMAMAAAMLASCAQTGLVEEIAEEPQKAIGFSTFVDKATRSENSSTDYTLGLYGHHETFNVWGYKNTDQIKAVFENVPVNYTSDWGYTDYRYWDKAATTYYFYACAPATPFTFIGGAANQATGKFTISTAYTVKSTNVSNTATAAVSSWKGEEDDKDLMIAAPCVLTGESLTNAQTTTGGGTGKVELKFIHILSRLNIKIAKYTGAAKITVNNITIGNMYKTGTFDEGNTSIDPTTGINSRWTKTGTKENLSYGINYQVPNDKDNYVIEALIMPQATNPEDVNLDGTGTINEAYIKINYSLTSGSTTEDFTACYNLAKVFEITSGTLDFNEGWQNTLTINLSPNAILFNGSVAPWADKVTKELPIE